MFQDNGSSADDGSSADGSSSDDEALMLLIHQNRKRRMLQMACMVGMYHLDSYCNKGPRRVPIQSGHDWVMTTLGNETACYNMFRMHRPVFEKLHSVLVDSYGLKSTKKCHQLSL